MLGVKVTNAPTAQPYMIVTMIKGVTWEVANGHAKLIMPPISTKGINVLSAPYLSARTPEESRPIKEAQLAIAIK